MFAQSSEHSQVLAACHLPFMDIVLHELRPDQQSPPPPPVEHPVNEVEGRDMHLWFNVNIRARDTVI
jgi:hypothetical protein